MLSTVFLICSLPSHQADTQEWRVHQNTAMHQVYRTVRNIRRGIDTFYTYPGGDINNSCTWRGVECRGGLVTSVVMPHCKLSLSIMYLPATVQFFHYRQHMIDGTYSVRYFPRDLRYMYIRFAYAFFPHEKMDDGVFDTCYLPQYSEEIHVCLNMQSWHTVSITTLPPNLRLLHLGSSRCIRSVVVNNSMLPPGLLDVSILKEKKNENIAISSLNHDQADPRIKAYKPRRRYADKSPPPQDLVEGAYFRTYDIKWAAVSREMGAPEQVIRYAFAVYTD